MYNRYTKDAYLKFAVMLEYINIKYIRAKYNVDMKESTVMKISKFYRENDKKLEDNMKAINAEYNDVDLDNLEVEDIEYLASYIDLMYKYMVDKVGEFIKK